jgi:type I restriction enzyme S subunit
MYVTPRIDSLTEEGAARSRPMKAGDLVIAVSGAPGLPAILKTNACIHDGFVGLRNLDQRTVNPEFLYRYLYYVKSQSAHGAVGAIFKNLTSDQIRDLEIPLPPLSEQKRIADILDKADSIRRKRQEELETLSALRSSVFLRLFGDPRTKRTDWPETQLNDVTILDAPMVDPRQEEYIDLVHLGPDRIEKNTGRLLPAQTAREEGLISGKFLFDERYLLYSKIRPYLRKVAMPNFRGLCSADVYPIRPVVNKATQEFLFALLISEAFLAYTTSLPSRASIPKLNRKELAAYTFHLPPIDLQQQYTKILRSHENTTETFGKASDESEYLFNSLVQRAFKGEL